MDARRNKGIHANVRVLVVDEHEFFRKGIHFALASAEGILIVADSHHTEALNKCQLCSPDMILIGINSSNDDFLKTMHLIRNTNPDIKVLALIDNDQLFFDALKLRIQGFLLKDINPETLIHGIKLISTGNIVLPGRSLTEILLNQQDVIASEIRRDATFTNREQQVLQLISQGERNRRIATHLGISESTVQTYVRKIFKKLHCKNRHEAITYALQYGHMSSTWK